MHHSLETYILIIEFMDLNEFNFAQIADKYSFGDIGIQAIGWAQGPSYSVQVFGDWPHQIQ